MNKPVTTALLILVSGLALSTTALAEPFKRGSEYVNYRNYDDGPDSLAEFRKRQNNNYPRANVRSSTLGGFNDRSSNEEAATGSRTVVETPLSRMLSTLLGGFNDRS